MKYRLLLDLALIAISLILGFIMGIHAIQPERAPDVSIALTQCQNSLKKQTDTLIELLSKISRPHPR